MPDARPRRMHDILDEDQRLCGETIDGNYIVGDVLGVGGMGIVYAGVQRSLNRPVAIKMPRTDIGSLDGVAKQFHTEALVAARVSHRNVIAVIDVGVWNGRPYLVLEQVRGQPLSKVLRSEGALEPARAVMIVAQALDALAASHEAEVVHADVKPDNVFIADDLDPASVRVFDFGIARIDGWAECERSPALATPEYVAPELIRGERPSAASDIYAAGIMLYELLTGTTPFGGGTPREVLGRHLQMTPLPPSRTRGDGWISLALDHVTLRALAKRPAERYNDARHFAAHLRAVV